MSNNVKYYGAIKKNSNNKEYEISKQLFGFLDKSSLTRWLNVDPNCRFEVEYVDLEQYPYPMTTVKFVN